MAATVVSGGQTVVRLAGSKVCDVLAKGCTLDFHPRVFKPGDCAQSTLGKAPITIRQIDEAPAYDIVVRRSFADYLWLWLQDGAKEYGLAVIAPPVAITDAACSRGSP